MKRLAYILLSFSILLGCSNDDDSNPEVVLSGLSGKWNLVNVNGGFVGVNHDFENGIIVWDFNETNNKVVITNSNTDDTIEDSFPTGTYNYSILEVQGNQELVVDNRNLGNFEISGSQFIVDENFRDGFRFTFSR
ncbi:hypothetical protein [Aquimarina sp. AU474]|uniref:hypothetical protein n=1 Tax=Aquimarina sp. AU474 TaxID=2108529 RepID=UPI000D695F1E|nr:hypothetical protein [Aquimarina sp. AU474]